MLEVRLNKKLESRLNRLIKETGHTKSYYAKKAIEEFLNDRENYRTGLAALEKKESTIDLRKLERKFDLERMKRVKQNLEIQLKHG